MIRIKGQVIREQKSFFNQCVFHPTDAVEDPWGRRILDRMARDKAINTIRIYAMLEDIVYLDENGELAFDFRLNDLRLDYLRDKGYNLVIAYAGIPDCISTTESGRTSVSKNKTRYKGKLWNTNPPADYAMWERICYEYTKHIIERYGELAINNWRVHCFNEPDIACFFLSQIEERAEENIKVRCNEYLRLYEAFARGVKRAAEKLRIGGPAHAVVPGFLECFLNGVKERKLPMDYISIHVYGTDPFLLNSGEDKLSVDIMMKRMNARLDIIKKCGFEKTPIVVDEWGASSHGFFNSEECKILMFRETEVFSSYFVRLIRRLMDLDISLDGHMICLSGQHEMTEDFTGFRNFFTLNFIAKPIYNAYLLSSRMYSGLVDYEKTADAVDVIPTRDENGEYMVAVTYSDECFTEDIEAVKEVVSFDENIIGKAVTVWCIDKEHTNPYRLYERLGIDKPTEEEILLLREEGNLKPIATFTAVENEIEINLSANSTYFISIK